MTKLTVVPSAAESRGVGPAPAQSGLTPIPAALQKAWINLAGATAIDPIEHGILYAAADALVEVYPPYPPASAITTPIPAAEAVDAARALLLVAAAESASVEERLRIARVLRILGRLGSKG
jgi:hypothetical protein